MNQHNKNDQVISRFENPFASNRDDEKKALFVGDQYQNYYKEKFDRITPKKVWVGMNWGALLFGILWLFYRKMYAYGFVALVFLSLLTIIESFMGIEGYTSSIVVAMVFGLMGDAIYKQFVGKEISKITQFSQNVDDNELVSKGGTNIWAPAALFLILLILVCIGLYIENLGYLNN